MVEFINLRLESMSVHDYSLKFIQLAKYPLSLVSYPRDKMSRFVTCVSVDLQEEYHSVILHYNRNISRIMVLARRVEEDRSKRKHRDSKSESSFEGRSKKNMLDI